MVLEKRFYIRGMHCAACSAGSEKIMRRLKGVESAEVNLAAELAEVRYDPELVKLSEIRAAVLKLGFTTEDYEDRTAAIADETRRERERLQKRRRLLAAVIGSALLMTVAMGHMISLPLPRFLSMEDSPLGNALAQLVLTLCVMAAGRDFYISGFKGLVSRIPSMDTLVGLGTGSAFLYSLYGLVRIAMGQTGFVHALFFDSAAMVVTLVMVGKYLESGSKERTGEAVRRLMKLAPDSAMVEKDGRQITVETGELMTGDLVVVLPGAHFPCDGVVESGFSTADNAMLTGESLPVTLEPGSKVTGGAINGEGTVKFRATQVGGDTALSQIIRLVEDAQGHKAPIARMADRVSAVFVPVVLAIAFVSAGIWLFCGKDLSFVLNTFVSVLVIACPCSLGLATPTAILVGTGRGAEMGILFKSGEALQAMQGIRHVVLDKTGTLTEGKPMLTHITPCGSLDENTLLTMAASLEQSSEHPVARAIVQEAKKRELQIPALDGVTAVPGYGVTAQVKGRQISIGSAAMMEKLGVSTEPVIHEAEALSRRGAMLMYCCAETRLLGLFAASDMLKPESRDAVRRLQELGVKVTMLTGDNEAAAAVTARAAGVDDFVAGVLPAGKSQAVTKLQTAGTRTAMVGDGINDAPALAAADVGIAIGTGTDVAIASADVVLMGGALTGVADALRLSRGVMKNIRQNLFWALFYNCIGIPFAAGLFYAFGGPRLNPMIAGACMACSSVCVVSNALRLKKFH